MSPEKDFERKFHLEKIQASIFRVYDMSVFRGVIGMNKI